MVTPAASLSIGRYVVGAKLAAGGMGEVYLGVQRGLGDYAKPVALKVLLPHLSEDPTAVQMFLEEARLAARMSHPNVVGIFDVGEEAGRYYLAMELVQGVPLSALIRALAQQKVALPADLLVHVARGLCDGLHCAHELRDENGQPLEVVHRDVSPQNVLISKSGDVKVTDFGIAKARDSRTQTAPGILKGKRMYLAPEQALGKAEVDRRADVFAAGVTLIELATLTSPFDRASELETLQAVISAPMPDLRALCPQLPEAVCNALARACEKDPAKRFQTVKELRDALPAPDPKAAERLGARVQQLAPAQLETLERKRAATMALSDSSLTAPGLPTDAPPPRRRRAAPLAIGAAVLLAVGAVLARLLLPAAAPAEVPPAPVARAEPEPQPTPPAPTPEPEPPAPPTVAEPSPSPALAPARASRQRHVAAAPRTGFLTVDAVPWAAVAVEGVSVGYTPLDAFPIATGSHTVVLRNEKSGKSVTRTVQVRPGKTEYLKVDLR